MSTPKKTSPLIARSKSIQAELNNKAALVVQSLRNKRQKDDNHSDLNSMPNSRKNSLDNIQISSDNINHNALRKILKSPIQLPKTLNSYNNNNNLNDLTHLKSKSSISDINSETGSLFKSLDVPDSAHSSETFGVLDVPLTPCSNSFEIPTSTTVDPLTSLTPSNSKKNNHKTNLSSNLPLDSSKAPHRRTTISDGFLRDFNNSCSMSNTNSNGSVKSNENSLEYLSAKLSTILPAPAPSMYWRNIPEQENHSIKPIRSHSSTLVGDQLFIFGGVNSRSCFNDTYVFDTDTMYWSKPQVGGTPPSPRRAHSATLVDETNIFVFGGGISSNYYNDLYVFNTVSLSWTCPPTYGDIPAPRRAHSTCYYKDALYVFGGGDGLYPLNDLYRLDLTTNNGYQWSKIETRGKAPSPRGYHSANLLGSQIIIYGGSDGTECFDDIHILDLETFTWKEFSTKIKVPRLAHSATLVGPYLYVSGGRNRTSYSGDLLVLNLQRGTWEARKVFGSAPSPRGYHSTILHDARLFLFGGFDGIKFYNDMHVLDLSASAYLSQIKPLKLLV